MTDDVAVRRKKLAEIRTAILQQTPDKPFSLASTLSSGETISDFVVAVALNIHRKRTNKSKIQDAHETTTSTVGGMASITG